ENASVLACGRSRAAVAHVPDKPPRRYRPTRGADRAVRAAAIPALPKSALACPAGQCGLRLETRFPRGCHGARAEWMQLSRGIFLKASWACRSLLGCCGLTESRT